MSICRGTRPSYDFTRLRRSAFIVMTKEREENAIAAPSTMGGSSIADGIHHARFRRERCAVAS